ncbi:F0F1 ATP synthase subunit epsilon [Opitutales bacterium ASA1]|uniref:ATP synthase F1 subunit epsilon n=1 Tax=Congregicoccus parvus TaxID=3081749 RepID=UPI002B3073CD|nr:F0F1 ATP synthase subunit epsilon [Opitutales bacterium ASA1]
MPLVLEIVTPEARVFSDTVDSVVVPTVNGELGILPGHIPLLSQVADGELRIQRGASIEELIVGAGFVQVQGDKVSILAENAIEEAKIDPAAAEKAMQRAQDALRNTDGLDPTEVERLEGVVRFAVAQLASRKRR